MTHSVPNELLMTDAAESTIKRVNLYFWLKFYSFVSCFFKYHDVMMHSLSPLLVLLCNGEYKHPLTYWGRVKHIYASKLTIIGSNNDVLHVSDKAVSWTNAGMLSIWALENNFSEISIEIRTFPFKKMYYKMASSKWRPFCLSLNVLIFYGCNYCPLSQTPYWFWWHLLAEQRFSWILLCFFPILSSVWSWND